MADFKNELFLKNLKIIFGEKLTSQGNLPGRFSETELKKAFKKKAMLFHPDRIAYHKLDEKSCIKLFQTLTDAYTYLRPFAKQKPPEGFIFDNAFVIRPGNNGKNGRTKETAQNDSQKKQSPRFYNYRKSSPIHEKEKPKKQKKTKMRSQAFSKRQTFFTGKIPHKPLRFAQFLYYNKIISWQTLIEALTWQMINRPKIGEIGQNGHFFSENDISRILKGRSVYEKFGETALKMDIITPYELKVILGHQKRFDYPIGRFFLEKNFLNGEELKQLLKHHRQYNKHTRRQFQI